MNRRPSASSPRRSAATAGLKKSRLTAVRPMPPLFGTIMSSTALYSSSGRCKYLHKILEQDPPGVQQVTRPRLEGQACAAAQGRLAASEFMHMMKKRQTVVKAGEVERTVAERLYSLAAYSPHGQGQ